MTNKRIAVLLTVLGIMFLSLIVYITVFDLSNHDTYAIDASSEREEYILRGSVLDRNEVVLAQSTGEGLKQQRKYPYKNLYSHIIGYKSSELGSNEIEKYYNSDLIGNSSTPLWGDAVTLAQDIKSMFSGKSQQKGYNITLTLDHELQKAAHSALGSYKGSVVALNPSTGEILAMVSKPDFDPSPEALKESIRKATEENQNALLRRATMENYSPGSTFKLIIAASMLENGEDDFVFDDNGELTVKIKNYGEGEGKFLGETNLEQGFKNSSNIYFSEAAIKLGEEKIRKTAESFLFERELRLDRLGVAMSKLPEKISTPGDITNMALGQGDVKASPLHLALIASAIANDGIMMSPYIIDSISGPGGVKARPTMLKRCISSSTSLKLKNLMKLCVESGTGTAAAIYGKQVCGKTGTAEVDTDAQTAHALFVGFAPYDNPEIAICVIVENLPHKNTGGTVAAPIARTVMQKYFELMQ